MIHSLSLFYILVLSIREEKTMKITDIDKISNHDIKKVSGGQHQRAARSDLVFFLSDGDITDEIVLEKYEEKSTFERENKMIKWI